MTNRIYRLAEARELRGLTVADLAEELDITRQQVYKYESGVQRPGPEIVERIVNVLAFPYSFFSVPPIGLQIDDRPIFFRDMKSNLDKYRRQSRRWLQLLYDRVVEYEKYVDLPEPNIPSFEGLDYKALDMEEVDTYAEKTRRFWGLGDGPISDLTVLLENNGIVVAHKYIQTDKLDACSLMASGRPCILLNTYQQTCSRVLMNLAHELGHLVLHQEAIIEDIENSETNRLMEEQAWRFASAFLMPPSVFTNEVGYPSMSQFLLLKKRWRVSIAAMIMHCAALCIIDAERKQYFFRELSRNGQRRQEPLDNELVIEKGTLLFDCEKTIVEHDMELKDILFQRSCLNPNDYSELIGAPIDYMKPEVKRPKLRLV